MTTSTQASSSVTTNHNVVFVVFSTVSLYKKDPSCDAISTYVFKNENKAYNFMRDLAKELYYDYVADDGDDEYDSSDDDDEEEDTRDYREKTPPEQNSRNDHFFYEGRDSIEFGSNRNCGLDYRSTYGFVAMRREVIDDSQ